MADRHGSGEEVAAPPQHAAVEPSSLDTAGATSKKQRLSHEYVSYIMMTMPIEEKLQDPDNLPSYLLGDNLPELQDVSEEWLEEKRLAYREGAARDRRIHANWVQFQNRVRDEWLEKGYVEVDDNYFTNIAKIEEEASARWEEVKKQRDPALTLFSDLAAAYEDMVLNHP